MTHPDHAQRAADILPDPFGPIEPPSPPPPPEDARRGLRVRAGLRAGVSMDPLPRRPWC